VKINSIPAETRTILLAFLDAKGSVLSPHEKHTCYYTRLGAAAFCITADCIM